MQNEVIMPRFTMTMIDGTISRWFKAEGDTVTEGEPLVEVESDKAVNVLNSAFSGTVLKELAKPGDIVPIEQVIAVIGDASPVPTAKSTPDMTDATEAHAEPAKTYEVIMPRFTMTMIDGTISSWMKQEGDQIREGDPLVEVETDKAVNVLNAAASGTLLKILAKPGDVVPIEQVIAVIGDKGAETAVIVPTKADVPVQAAVPASASKTAVPASRVIATPLAKRLARQWNVDLTNAVGTGLRGMVTKADVEKLKNAAPQAVPAPTPKVVPTATAQFTPPNIEDEDEVVPMSGIRFMIAAKMAEARRTAADVTTFAEVKLDAIMGIRQYLKIPYTTFVVRAAALALKEFPAMNTQLDEANNSIVYKKHININVAVGTEKGLMTPVVTDADGKNLLTLAEVIADFGKRGRDGKLQAAEMQNGTFTVTNSGTYGALFFTPIINMPQCAILGMGKMFTLPTLDDKGQVVPTSMMILCLSYDHRIVDGETAVKFLQCVKKYIENPDTMR